MADNKPEKILQDMVAQDWAARLRDLERLEPRVQALEHAVSEIRSDFREARAEQQEEHRETRQALNAFRKRMDTDYRETMEAISAIGEATKDAVTGLGVQLGKLSKKISFAAGAIWVLTGLAGTALLFRSELLNLITLAAGTGS